MSSPTPDQQPTELQKKQQAYQELLAQQKNIPAQLSNPQVGQKFQPAYLPNPAYKAMTDKISALNTEIDLLGKGVASNRLSELSGLSGQTYQDKVKQLQYETAGFKSEREYAVYNNLIGQGATNEESKAAIYAARYAPPQSVGFNPRAQGQPTRGSVIIQSLAGITSKERAALIANALLNLEPRTAYNAVTRKGGTIPSVTIDPLGLISGSISPQQAKESFFSKSELKIGTAEYARREADPVYAAAVLKAELGTPKGSSGQSGITTASGQQVYVDTKTGVVSGADKQAVAEVKQTLADAGIKEGKPVTSSDLVAAQQTQQEKEAAKVASQTANLYERDVRTSEGIKSIAVTGNGIVVTSPSQADVLRETQLAKDYASGKLSGSIDITTPEELATSKNPVLDAYAGMGKSLVPAIEGVTDKGAFINLSEGTERLNIAKAAAVTMLDPRIAERDQLVNDMIHSGKQRPEIEQALKNKGLDDASLQNARAGLNVIDAVLPTGALVSVEQVQKSVENFYNNESVAAGGLYTGASGSNAPLYTRTMLYNYQQMTADQKAAVDKFAKQQGLTRTEATAEVLSNYAFIESTKTGQLEVTKIRKVMKDDLSTLTDNFSPVQLAKYLQTAPPAIKSAIGLYAADTKLPQIKVAEKVAAGELIPFYSERMIAEGAQPFRLLTPSQVASEEKAEERVKAYAIAEMKQYGWTNDEIKTYYNQQGYDVPATLIEKTPALQYNFKPKTPLEQVESGLAKPYQPVVGMHPEVSLFDDVFAAGKIAYGETVGLFDPNAKKVAREGYATMNKVGAYYGAYPIEGIAEAGSEAAFAIATGFGIGTAAKAIITKTPRLLIAIREIGIDTSKVLPTAQKGGLSRVPIESGLELPAAQDIFLKQDIRAAIETSTDFAKAQKRSLLRQLGDVEKLTAEVNKPVETGLEASHYRVLNRIMKDVNKAPEERYADMNQYLNELKRTGNLPEFKETGRINEIVKKYGAQDIVSSKPAGNLYSQVFDLDVAKPTFSEVAYRSVYEPAKAAAAKTGEQAAKWIDDVKKYFGVGAAAGAQAGIAATKEYDTTLVGGYSIAVKPVNPLNPFGIAPSSLRTIDSINRINVEMQRSVADLNRFTAVSNIAFKQTTESPKGFENVRAAGSFKQKTQQEEEPYTLAELNKIKGAGSIKPKKKQQVEEIFDLEAYVKQITKSVAASTQVVKPPLTTITDKMFNVDVLKGVRAASSIKGKSIPSELVRLQKGIDTSFKQPFGTDLINVTGLDLGQLYRQSLKEMQRTTYRTPTKLTTTDYFMPAEPFVPRMPPFKPTGLPPSIPFGIPKGLFFDMDFGAEPKGKVIAWERLWKVVDDPITALFSLFEPVGKGSSKATQPFENFFGTKGKAQSKGKSRKGKR